MRSILPLIFLSLFSLYNYAQGDGPRAFLLIPKGVTGVNVKWFNMYQNIAPADIFSPGVNLSIDAFPVTFFQSFSIAGKYAQAYLMNNPGSATATATSVPLGLPIPVGTQVKASGFSDGMVGLRLGLIGAQAYSVPSFIKEKMRFSLFIFPKFWFSGKYNPNAYLNMGSNRNTFQLEVPMAIPLNKNRERATWLEVSPAISIFNANNEPSKGYTSKKITQAPLFIVENHLSHNFNRKFWGVFSLRIRQGGEISQDDVKSGNKMNILGIASGFGYQALPYMGFLADYGKIMYGYKGAKSEMIRLAVTVTYANMNKK